jgi:predicted regulator of Ras-like GTPase activity (Roadblock/LC7/MglB family)
VNALSRTLAGLRDVDEVQGSFVLSRGGELIARDLPAVFHAELFADVGPRLARLRDTFDPGHGSSTLTMRFTDHKLYVRSVGDKLLCVLGAAAVNEPALRMAMNLVARQLENAPLAESDEPAPNTLPSSTSSAHPEPPSRREAVYRGQLR